MSHYYIIKRQVIKVQWKPTYCAVTGNQKEDYLAKKETETT
jgi:hypothetical protein